MKWPDPCKALRVLTVNIHKGYTAFRRRYMLQELREAVRAVEGDLVLLQEVQGAAPGGDSHSNAFGVAQAEYLADRIWRDHAWARNAVATGGGHGNAVLSRWPILSWRNHVVAVPGDEPRGLLHCRLAVPPAGLHVICVHLGLREAHRRQQLQVLRELIQRHVPADAPLVVGGDFNDWRSRADGELQDTGLVEVWRTARGRHARTFPAHLPLLRLDRLYVRHMDAQRPLKLPRRPWSILSDHAPIAADLCLPGAAA
jgi:endonuclease/exonuclease/phosphatase family metal-dependent hydrolase